MRVNPRNDCRTKAGVLYQPFHSLVNDMRSEALNDWETLRNSHGFPELITNSWGAFV